MKCQIYMTDETFEYVIQSWTTDDEVNQSIVRGISASEEGGLGAGSSLKWIVSNLYKAM